MCPSLTLFHFACALVGERLRALHAPFPPLLDLIVSYMNRPDVQEALHVVVGTVWEVSSSKIQYSDADMLRPMMPYYNRLLDDYDMTILVFSGVRPYCSPPIPKKKSILHSQKPFPPTKNFVLYYVLHLRS